MMENNRSKYFRLSLKKRRIIKKNQCGEIFISYAGEDSSYAMDLYLYLDSLGFECFMASAIPKGNDYPKEIRDALKRAEIFIPLLTKNGLGSFWVQQEVGFASCIKHQRGIQGKDLLIIPVFKEKTEPPGMIKRHQGITFSTTVIDTKAALEEPLISQQTFREIADCLKRHWKPSDLFHGLIEKKLELVNNPRVAKRQLEYIGSSRDLIPDQFKKIVKVINQNRIFLGQPLLPGILSGGLNQFEKFLKENEKKVIKSLIRKTKKVSSTNGTADA